MPYTTLPTQKDDSILIVFIIILLVVCQFFKSLIYQIDQYTNFISRKIELKIVSILIFSHLRPYRVRKYSPTQRRKHIILFHISSTKNIFYNYIQLYPTGVFSGYWFKIIPGRGQFKNYNQFPKKY